MKTESKIDIEKTLGELRSRNEERAKEAIEKLGPKWVLHSANSTKKKPRPFILN